MESLAWFLVVLLINRCREASSAEAMFVFGDSLSDPGNNNALVTIAKGNYPPHGIDFPGGVTGRFCNGLIGPDHLGNLLGLGLIPAFQNPNTQGSNILKGVNFASSAAGVLHESGAFLGERWTFDQQIEQFATKTLPELRSQALRSKEGNKELSVDEFLANSLFYSNVGANDFINYVVRNYKDPERYIDWVITEHRRQLKELYQLGGRKFLVFGLAPMGCLPMAILLFNKNAPDDCAEQLNHIVLRWNAKLTELIQQLNHDHSGEGAYFLYFDIYSAFFQITNNPSHYGFKQVRSACCGAGLLHSEFMCLTPKAPVCPNRSEYVFWDSFHPTELMYGILHRQAFDGTLQNTFPKNVQQLFQF